MESSSRKLQLSFVIFIGCLTLLVATKARSDASPVMLGTPTGGERLPQLEANLDNADGNYPESSFGKGPAQPDLGANPYPFVPRKPENAQRSLASVSEPKTPTDNSALKKAMAQGQSVQEIAVIADDLGFIPKKISVTQGVPVKLFVTAASKKTLCLMIDQFAVRRQIRSHRIEEISFVPEGRDPIRFYCPVNGAKEGFFYIKDPHAAKES